MTGAWHAADVREVTARLASDLAHGLEPGEAAARLERDGPNEIRRAREISPLAIFANQFRSLVIWVLLGAAVVAVGLGELVDGVAIVAIVLLNAVIGFFQEYRAEHAVAALARLAAPRCRVVRGGRTKVVPARDVVRGDVVLLEAGDLVPADARLGEAASLRTNEAALTGESQPVEKAVEIHAPDTPLADRRNMVFLGTSVAGGTGRAVVVAAGMATEVGRIATLLESASSDETPLQRKLDLVARRLLWASLAIVVVVVALGLLRDVPPLELFMGAVSLAVAAIPEGLPAVVTVALALGVSRMVHRNALVRRLPSVETLGCAQVICSDKTGTLTVGEMTARKIVTSESVLAVTGEGYGTDGGFFEDGAELTPTPGTPLFETLLAAAACNDAELSWRDHRPAIVGDPTEGALLVAAAKGGVRRERVEVELPRLGSVPFGSDRKRMTIVRRRDAGAGAPAWAFVKGAPEVVLERCTAVRTPGGVALLDAVRRERLRMAGSLLASDGLRVLALAERRLDAYPAPEDVEQDLTFLGLVGLQDPPRAEVHDAVARCKRAGIQTVMITGDHPNTARAIARELGILESGQEVMVSAQLERLTDDELARRVSRVAVYARVTAEHKLRIVRAWKANGMVVAMTGDGVNDAPALREASIGVAMGITGTEVTKEAADMVITDDNFASIIAAVEEGRGIYDNIAKTLSYLLAGNAGELAVMLVAGLVGWPLPLLPAQLLWINLVTDGLPALALATDPIDPDVLQRPPRRPDAQLADRAFLVSTALTGALTATVTLAAFALELYTGGRLADARNAAFSVLVFAELLRAFGARSATRTLWEVGLLSNLRLFGVVLVSFGLQIVIHHVPVLESVFGTEPITLAEYLGWMGLAAVPLAALEARKVVARRRARPTAEISSLAPARPR